MKTMPAHQGRTMRSGSTHPRGASEPRVSCGYPTRVAKPDEGKPHDTVREHNLPVEVSGRGGALHGGIRKTPNRRLTSAGTVPDKPKGGWSNRNTTPTSQTNPE